MRATLVASVIVIGAVAGITAQPSPQAQEPSREVREHYTKYEYRLQMRDGAQPLHLGVRAQDLRRAVPDPAEPDAVLSGAVRRGSVPRAHRAVGAAR